MIGPLIVLAPSKTMDFTTPLPFKVAPETPPFLAEAETISDKLRGLSSKQVATLMAVSPRIALSVHTSYALWQAEASGRPALWTYKGDVYKGVRANYLSETDADWAQQHIVIASGLYGLVRPFDGIQSYRLEMKTALKIGRSTNLCTFWGKKLAHYVDAQGSDWVCNLSSEEYAKPVTKFVQTAVVTPVFFDTKPNGVVGTVPIYSKMMRGVMARWMIDQRVETPAQLQKFKAHGYSYDAQRSKKDFPAFSRAVMAPLVFT